MEKPDDLSLAQWIGQLIRNDELYKFYKSPQWLSLRADVLASNHYECEMCKEKSPAVYSKAVTVHHVNEVKASPALALSRHYIDGHETKDNLLPLCNRCHNEIHDRFNGPRTGKRKFTNEERW